MSELGSGSGSGFPGAIDTNAQLEYNQSEGNRTKARAAVPNDLAAAIVAIETTLGVNPHGNLSTVKTRLDGLVTLSGIETITGEKTFTGGVNVGASGLWGTHTGVGVSGFVRVSGGTQFAGGDFWLSGTHRAGVVPLARMQSDEQTAKNSGAVTVLSTATTVIAVASMTVVAGDRIQVTAPLTMLKGATGGIATVRVVKVAGTATVVSGLDQTTITDLRDHPAANTHQWALSGMFRVTVGGTLTLELQAASGGSNGTVAAGDGQLHALVLKGT